MDVIVTGGSGRGGSVTVAELVRSGHSVVNVDIVPPREPQEAMFIQVDLKDAGEVYDAFCQVRPEGVCHIAANPKPHGFPRGNTFANNVMSSYNVMQAAGEIGAKRLVYASSVMAAGWAANQQLPPRFPITVEDRIPSPNAYGMSKFIGEVIADGMVRRYPELTIASLRVIGIMDPERYEEMAARRPSYSEKAVNFWSYLDARDFATAFRAALEGANQGHEAFLVAAADNWAGVVTREAIDARFRSEPGFDAVEFADDFGLDDNPFASAFDISKMERFFAWRPRHSWRDQ